MTDWEPLTAEQREAVERSYGGGLVAYIERLRASHRPTFFYDRVNRRLAQGVCICDEPVGCPVGLLIHIDDLKRAYELKVQDFARETLRTGESGHD